MPTHSPPPNVIIPYFFAQFQHKKYSRKVLPSGKSYLFDVMPLQGHHNGESNEGHHRCNIKNHTQLSNLFFGKHLFLGDKVPTGGCCDTPMVIGTHYVTCKFAHSMASFQNLWSYLPPILLYYVIIKLYSRIF